MVVWVINLHDPLKELLLQSFRLKPKRPIGETTEALIEVLVDVAGKNKMPKRHLRSYFAVVGVEPHLNQRMLQHFLEHRGVALFWQGLELLREITIVAVRTDRRSSKPCQKRATPRCTRK